ERKIFHHRLNIIVAHATDGAGGTGQQRLQRMAAVGARYRLSLDERGFGGFAEDRWSDLAASIAVDACRIDEEIARDVLRHSFFRIGHDKPPAFILRL